MLLGTLGPTLLIKFTIRKKIVRAGSGKGIVKAGSGNKNGKGIVRASYGNEIGF